MAEASAVSDESSDESSDERAGPAHAEHFESLAQQSHAAHLGMWVFLASEALLFAGLFALYAALRWQHGRGFDVGIAHSEKLIGSINTGILLLSSYAVATAVLALRDGKRTTSLLLVLFTIGGGAAFLALKLHEYSRHFDEGIYPGGAGRFFQDHPEPGIATFFTLYFIATGLHSIHVIAGMGVLAWLAWKLARGTIDAPYDHPLALGAMYWHLVDIVWIFLWPLFYLTAGG
ncbi:MAG: cytochrome c oxidase subunit 3 family protein [Polyangiales bacterium]